MDIIIPSSSLDIFIRNNQIIYSVCIFYIQIIQIYLN